MSEVQGRSKTVDESTSAEVSRPFRAPSTPRRPAVILLPVIVTAIFLLLFGVDVPYFDEWDLAPLVDLVARGEATFQDYYEQHGVHRVPVPKFILSHLAVATGWNVVLEMFVNLGLVLATLPALLILSRRTLQVEGRDRTLISVAIATVLFAPIALDSWLSGWHLGWFLTNACVVWAITIMTASRPNGPARLSLAAGLCLVATFSIAHGLASWLALIPVVATGFRRRGLALTAWLSLFALSATAYFSGYVPNHPELPRSLAERLATMALYFFAVIGSPLGGVSWIAVSAGVVFFAVVLVFTIVSRRGGFEHDALPWITLALYVFAFAAANAVGRAGWGLERALSHPYKLVSALILIALLHLAALASIRSGRDLRRARLTAWTIIVIMAVGFVSILPQAAQQRSLRKDGALCLQMALLIEPDTPACRPALAWDYRDPIAEARRLHEAGVFNLPDRTSFGDRIAAGEIDVESSGWERFGKTGRRLVIRGSFETGGRDRTLLVLTWGDPPRVLTTRLHSHRGELTSRWAVELPPGTELSGPTRAWIYDQRERSFRRLRGEVVIGGRTGGPPI